MKKMIYSFPEMTRTFRRRDKITVVVLLGSMNEFVITISDEMESREVQDRMSTFPKAFVVADSDAKGTKIRCEPRVRLRRTEKEFSDNRCILVE
jgi:hypothetical protein